MRHDVESSKLAPNLLPPLLRRRRGWLGLLLLVVLPLTLLLMLVYTSPPTRERMLGGVEWVKNSVQPTSLLDSAAAKQPLAVPLAQAPQALDKLTKLVLFVARLTRDPSFTVPSDAEQREKALNPDSEATIRWLEQGSATEAAQFKASPHAWAQSHLPPLIVFSKTYCPYSKRAKALLTSLNANFLTIEVDLRKDEAAVKAAMATLTAHSTFPTVMLSGQLLGGSDDLVTLHSDLQVLTGMLNGAGALKAPA